MKTLFILSLLSFSLNAQWVELDPGVDVPYFSDVYAITPDTVIVVGANGTILKTTDGGETWVQKPSGTTFDLSKIQFVNSEIGYVVGGNGTFLKTIDGGESWISKDIGQTFALRGLSCINDDLIYASANENYIMKTEDGGDNWDMFPIELHDINLIQFFENEIGYVHSRFGEVLKTENSCENWEELAAFPSFQFLNANMGYFYSGGLYKTINGGNDFAQISDGIWGESKDIFVINEDMIWGLFSLELLDWSDPQYGIIKIDRDQSELYEESVVIMNPPQYDLYSIHFADETMGYIVGYKDGKGAIWKNGTGINTMSVPDNEMSGEIKIYPNPVSDKINIEIRNIQTENTIVSFSDLTGKKVYSQSFDTSRIKINTNKFPKGTYILSVETKQKNHSQKIIIN